jgi:hypothetical protein
MTLANLTYKNKQHDFYHDGVLYNIVPSGSKPPKGGYFSHRYILQLKGYPPLPNLFFHIHKPLKTQP